MQISRLYSNKPELFALIEFNCREAADRLSIIYGEVHQPKDQKQIPTIWARQLLFI
jgi:hypothetical protein